MAMSDAISLKFIVIFYNQVIIESRVRCVKDHGFDMIQLIDFFIAIHSEAAQMGVTPDLITNGIRPQLSDNP